MKSSITTNRLPIGQPLSNSNVTHWKKHGIVYLFVAIQLLLLMTNTFHMSAQTMPPAHVGILYPISTQGTSSYQHTNRFSLHLLSGVSGGETGLAIYGLSGIVKGDATGVSVSGLANIVETNRSGLQISGLTGIARHCINCSQISGLSGLTKGDAALQVSGIYSHTDSMTGVQVSGIANKARKVEGVQVSGLVNLSTSLKGLQVAGLVNTSKDVEGTQISGLINRAGNVKGVQIAGLINLADSSDYPIGLINLVKSGEKRLGISTDENLTTMISFRSGGQKMYGIVGFGTSLRHPDLPYAFESGLGLLLYQKQDFRLEVEVNNLYSGNFAGNEYSKTGVRLLPALRIAQKLQLYGGPSVNYLHTVSSGPYDRGSLKLWNGYSSQNERAFTVGFTAGIQLIL